MVVYGGGGGSGEDDTDGGGGGSGCGCIKPNNVTIMIDFGV